MVATMTREKIIEEQIVLGSIPELDTNDHKTQQKQPLKGCVMPIRKPQLPSEILELREDFLAYVKNYCRSQGITKKPLEMEQIYILTLYEDFLLREGKSNKIIRERYISNSKRSRTHQFAFVYALLHGWEVRQLTFVKEDGERIGYTFGPMRRDARKILLFDNETRIWLNGQF